MLHSLHRGSQCHMETKMDGNDVALRVHPLHCVILANLIVHAQSYIYCKPAVLLLCLHGK